LIYITLANNMDEAIPEKHKNNFKFLKKIMYFIRCKLGIVLGIKIDDKDLLILPEINKRVLRKIEKIIKIRCIKNICLSNALLKDEEFMVFVKRQAINILDGKWLFGYLIQKTVEYIVQNKKEELENQEVSMLANDINDNIIYNITEIAGKVKVTNIITTKQEKFKTLEKKISEEKGIILNINKNYKKGLAKSDIIINFDFEEGLLNKYVLPKKACIVNVKKEIRIASKSFEGINVSSYKIATPRKYTKYLRFFKDFSEEILYESFIYKKTSVENIVEEINNDGVCITYLEGTKDKIRKSEYIKISNNESFA